MAGPRAGAGFTFPGELPNSPRRGLSDRGLEEQCINPNKYRVFPAFGSCQKKVVQGIVSYSRELLVRLPLHEMKGQARGTAVFVVINCPTLTSGVTQNMFRKSICLSALLALGMVGSSFAQNLTDSAQAQVGFSSNSSSGDIHSITPQMIHSVPSELVADDSTNGPNAIAGNTGA